MKYSLPFLSELLNHMPPKEQWKKSVKLAITEDVEEEIEEEAKCKSTLKYLNPKFNVNCCHNVESHIRSPREVTGAYIKCGMITGTYMIQVRRKECKQSDDDTCMLCREGTEDLTHFLLGCPATQHIRAKYLPSIIACIPHVYMHTATILRTPTLMTHLIMDSSHPKISNILPLMTQTQTTLERLTQNNDRSNLLACI